MLFRVGMVMSVRGVVVDMYVVGLSGVTGPKSVWNVVGKYEVTLNEDTEY